MDNIQIITEAKQLKPLTNKQLSFILAWYQDIKDKEFGFRDIRGFKVQLKAAIDFYLETEREWQEKVLKNETKLSFIEFFECTAGWEGIDLPINFKDRITKGETNEIQRTE